MSVDRGAVSKRSARAYFEDEHEMKNGIQGKKAVAKKNDESVQDAAARRTSIASSAGTLVNQERPQESFEVLASRSQHHFSDAGAGDCILALDTLTSSGKWDLENVYIPSAGRPVNFGVVVPGVYRSSYPKPTDYSFYETLNLKTIVTLVHKDIPDEYKSFMQSRGIKQHVMEMKGTKKESIPLQIMKSILELVLDRQNYPLLIHCNHGKHRTGCVVGIIRKLSGWELADILDEYEKYAEDKVRECDLAYISNLSLSTLSNLFVKDVMISQTRRRSMFQTMLLALVVFLLWFVSNRPGLASTKTKIV